MEITITARHTEVPARVRDRAQARIERLVRHESRLTGAEVTFDADHGACRVEVRLRGAGHSIAAHASAASFRTALDRAADRLDRQLRRRVEQRRTRKKPRLAALSNEVV